MTAKHFECGFIGADGKLDFIEVTRLQDSKPRYKLLCPADPVPSAESGSPTGSPSQQHALEDYLIRLIDALTDQTEALNKLASSNEELVRAMADGEGMMDDAPPGQYLDGRAVR